MVSRSTSKKSNEALPRFRNFFYKIMEGSPLVKFYLVLYDLASALGWAYVMFICYQGYSDGSAASALWINLEFTLTYGKQA